MTPSSKRTLRRWCYALAALSLTALAVSRPIAVRGGATRPSTMRSVVFYYQHIDDPSLASKFRGAGAVVTSTQTSDADAVRIVHSVGALAIRYVNAYWFPSDRTYEGIAIGRHVDWAFCDDGSRPLLGRQTGAERWYYLDLNERQARAALMRYLSSLKEAGYDGVFFDRGSPSLRPSAGDSIAGQISTCTGEPVDKEHPRFADVFASVLAQTKRQLGLAVYVNYGHPFSGVRLRPDLSDARCREHRRCHYRSDLLSVLDAIVDENQNDDRTASGFWRNYAENRANERATAHGEPLVIRGVKISSSDRALAFYRWARERLFDVATFVNTGDDDCPAAVEGCFRFGTYPELTKVRFGEPVDPRPESEGCTGPHDAACIWVRRYRAGASVVNASAEPRRADLELPDGACRKVVDVFAGSPLGGARGHCVRSFSYRMPPWSGRVFVYGDAP